MARMLDPRIKLRHLVCFVEVARSRSVAAAAAGLNMSQPSATKTIKELEVALGELLFDRSRRRLALTATGQLFQHYAETSLLALGQGIDALREARADTVIKVGALPTVSAQILPRAVRAFTGLGLPVRTRIVTGPNGYLLSLLRSGDVDLVIGRMADPDAIAGLAFEHLYSEQIVFAVRKGHPLLAADPFELVSIQDYQILMPPPDSVIRPTVERMLRAHGVSHIRDEVETVSNAFGRSYTRMSDAVWIISRGVVVADVADGQLALLPVDTAETLGPVGLTTRAGSSLSRAAQILIQSIREVAGEPRL
jgi:LysR family transcriptional regulator, pca operon transcriptional activator